MIVMSLTSLEDTLDLTAMFLSRSVFKQQKYFSAISKKVNEVFDHKETNHLSIIRTELGLGFLGPALLFFKNALNTLA